MGQAAPLRGSRAGSLGRRVAPPPCDGVGQVPVNDVLLCRVAGTDRQGCLGRLRTASRASAKLTK